MRDKNVYVEQCQVPYLYKQTKLLNFQIQLAVNNPLLFSIGVIFEITRMRCNRCSDWLP